MSDVIRAEWYRGTHSWRFWVTATLALIMFLLTMYQYASPWVHEDIPRWNNFFTVTLYFLGGYLDALWPIFIPLLAALPSGDSLAVDRRRGTDALAVTRVGWANYLWGKLLGNALVAVAAVTAAIAVAAAIAAVLYPKSLPLYLGWKYNTSLPLSVRLSGVFGQEYPPAFAPHLFWTAPSLYVVLAVLLALWATAALSSLCVASAVWLRQPLLTLAVPVVLYFGATILAEGLLTSHLVPFVYAGGYLYFIPRPSSWWSLILYWAVPAGVAALVVAWVANRRFEWPARSMER